jgi:hypothetical protein
MLKIRVKGETGQRGALIGNPAQPEEVPASNNGRRVSAEPPID